MPQIVSFIGWHNSGKTTLAAAVARVLRNGGYRVGVIKSSSETGIAFDTAGTDTAIYRQADVAGVLFVAPDQMVLQTTNDGATLLSLAEQYFPAVDIVIAEGFKHAARVAKIEVLRDPVRMLRGEVSGVIAVATDCDGISGENVFHIDQYQEIAAFIVQRFLQEPVRPPERAVLLINGKKVPMKGFVQDALAGTVLGFTGSLKLTGEMAEGAEVVIRLRSTTVPQ